MNILGMGINAIEVEKNLSSDLNKAQEIENILISKLIPGLYQPRNKISEESLLELSQSIKKIGIIQPIVVRYLAKDSYEIIAGERRYLAGKEIGLKELPCIVKDISEKDASVLAIVENIQRDQLSLLEESDALHKLKHTYSLSADEVAIMVGKPRTTIANLIRVSDLASVRAKEMCADGMVEFGHLRAVLSLNNKNQEELLQYVYQNKLSVRRTEELVRKGDFDPLLNKEIFDMDKNSFLIADNIISKFRSHFHSPVRVSKTMDGKIRMKIDFDNMESLIGYMELNIDSKKS